MKNTRAAILDDDLDFLVYLKQMLTTFGVQAETFSDGQALLDRLPYSGVNVVFLDMIMAERDGVQMLEAFSELGIDVPVVLVSSSEQKVINSAAQFGDVVGVEIVGTLRKPFWRGELGNLLESIDARPVRRGQLPLDIIEDGLENDRFKVHYQPIIDVNEWAVVGAEALARLELEDGELAAPSRFLKTMEIEQLVRPLMLRVLDQVIADQARFVDGGVDLRTSINMGIDLLELELLPDLIRDKCGEANVAPHRLMVEISERSVSENLRTVLRGATRFRLLNIGLSIDDFGRGHSTEERLHQLPFTELKIDKSVVTELADSAEARSVVRRIVQLAEELEVAVVAEGVETHQLQQLLLGMGCRLMQGFHVARPMPASELTSWVREWKNA